MKKQRKMTDRNQQGGRDVAWRRKNERGGGVERVMSSVYLFFAYMKEPSQVFS